MINPQNNSITRHTKPYPSSKLLFSSVHYALIITQVQHFCHHPKRGTTSHSLHAVGVHGIHKHHQHRKGHKGFVFPRLYV